MKLIGMLDSPYVRRVAVSLAYYGVVFENQQLSVFSTFDAFAQLNPVVKAPTLILDDGTQLMDSSLILSYFEAQADAQHQLLPSAPAALATDLALLGVILAASEKAVQHGYEHNLRPAENQHQPWTDRVTGQLLAGCRKWEAALSIRSTAREKPDQVAITSAVVWSFIQLMIPDVVKADAFTAIAAHAEKWEALDAFREYPQK